MAAYIEPDAALNELAERVIGACISVHRALGPGLPETVYEQALAIELDELTIPFARQAEFDVEYRGRSVGKGRIDFLVAGRLVIELKAVEALAPVHVAQTLTYLRLTGCRLGLVINFNEKLLTRGIKRVVLS